jgi:hypothetical protein
MKGCFWDTSNPTFPRNLVDGFCKTRRSFVLRILISKSGYSPTLRSVETKAFIMIKKTISIVTLIVISGILICSRPSVVYGLSWSSDSSSESKTPYTKKAQSKTEPSTIDKMTNGTKKFFNDVETTVGLKKTTPKKDIPSNAWVKPKKVETSKSSGFWSWFSSKEEPKKPKTPSDWLDQPRLDR